MSNSLDPDQARHFIEPDLSPNCLQVLSAEDTSRQRDNECKHKSLKFCLYLTTIASKPKAHNVTT